MSSSKRNRLQWFACAAVAICALFCTPAAFSANSAVDVQKSAPQVMSADFLKSAATIDMAEVQLGKFAQQRASHPDVQNFAKHMVDDHSQNQEELKKLAARENVQLPQQLDQEHQQLMAKLEKLSGRKFDEEYMNFMVEGHQKAVALFDNAAKSAQDADVRSFAEKTLPTLQEHLRMAMNTQAKLASAAVNKPSDSTNVTAPDASPASPR